MKSTPAGTARGSPEIWLAAAYDSLLEGGVEAVRIQPLAQKLNLSRTSFYWFFTDREELLAALLARWKTRNTANWIEQTRAYADSICEAVLNVFDCWFDDALFDMRGEAAIRAWAQQSPEIAEHVAKADARRISALTAMFSRFGCERLDAEVRARAMYYCQLGYVSLHVVESLPVRLKRIAAYVAVFTGKQPEQRELQRFFARRGAGQRIDRRPAVSAAKNSSTGRSPIRGSSS